MFVFFAIVLSIPTLGLLWGWWADRRLRTLGARPWQRAVLGLVILANVGFFAWLLVSRLTRIGPDVPMVLIASAMVWHMVVLPVLLAGTVLLVTGEGIASLARRFERSPRAPQAVMDPATRAEARGATPMFGASGVASPTSPTMVVSGASPMISRRAMLATGLAAAPVLLHAGALARGLTQLDEFRIRELVLKFPTLPPGLEGFTIAHVTDTHVGRFTQGKVLEAIVQRVNALQADVIVHTGDVINDALADLPAAADMLRGLRAQHGVFVVEGNHDLFESRAGFAKGLRERNVALLTNETATITHNNARLQLLGIQWGPTDVEDVRKARSRGAMFDEHLARVADISDSGAFRVALAHHPHTFDAAQRLGIPLTLAGHTHGGQLNPIEDYGPGQLLYKYVSGEYRDAAGNACVVGNGTGNWFPLRLNAPAEVIKLTLTRG